MKLNDVLYPMLELCFRFLLQSKSNKNKIILRFCRHITMEVFVEKRKKFDANICFRFLVRRPVATFKPFIFSRTFDFFLSNLPISFW